MCGVGGGGGGGFSRFRAYTNFSVWTSRTALKLSIEFVSAYK